MLTLILCVVFLVVIVYSASKNIVEVTSENPEPVIGQKTSKRPPKSARKPTKRKNKV